jgi:hypothetical protein
MAVGIWTCFCGDEMGPLVILPKEGTMTTKRCHESNIAGQEGRLNMLNYDYSKLKREEEELSASS